MEQTAGKSRTALMFSGQASLGRLLVVDDEPDVRKVVRLSLEKAGYDVIEAEDGHRLCKNQKWRKPSFTGRDPYRHSHAQTEWT